MNQNTVESSVLFSLAELQRMEQDRIGAEEHERATARQRRERERREAEAERNRVEQVRLASERAETAEAALREKEIQARQRAREQAALEVARIEAEARVQLAADEQMRTHEVASLHAQAQAGLYRVCVGLSVTLGVVLCSVAFGAWRLATDLDHARQAALQLQRDRDDVVRDRDQGSLEFSEAQRTWENRLQAMNKDLSACETQRQDLTPNTTSSHDIKRPPPPAVKPPVLPCKEGDPLCDATRQPR